MNKMMRISLFICIQMLTQVLFAADLVSGFKTITDFVLKLGIVISVIAFMAAGIMFLVNKNLGSEKLSGAIIGTIIIASASGISSLLISTFS